MTWTHVHWFAAIAAVVVLVLLVVWAIYGLRDFIETTVDNATLQSGEKITLEMRQAFQLSGDSQELRQNLLREAILRESRSNRQESSVGLKQFSDQMLQQLARQSQSNDQRLSEVRNTLETKLRDLQTDNEKKLEEMRLTVDEKLHATLEKRLGESFQQVSERLEQVHRGLGEMHTLAAGVGDLKRVLSNVKTRGTWGEVQLGNLLEQVLIKEQYAQNVATVPGSNERVEFAIRLPGTTPQQPVWLPIDAKFPREDFDRLIDAQERADIVAAEQAGKMLEQRVKLEAKLIRDKYICVPATTDFALMYLPTEGLYAEVIRRPGLADELQRTCRVVLAGPSTLAALLNSLQMGFKTLAIEQRSSEVWQLLGAVKTEFGKFGDVLAKTKRQLDTVSNSLGEAETRTRVIERRLRSVESLPESASSDLLDGLDTPILGSEDLTG